MEKCENSCVNWRRIISKERHEKDLGNLFPLKSSEFINDLNKI